MQPITNRTLPVRSSLLLAVVLILGFLLAACSLASTAQPPAVSMSVEPGATATPAPTSTPTRTPTPVPTRTPTLTFTPRPTYTRQPTRTPSMFNQSAPAAGLEAYELRAWSEDNYAELLTKLVNGDYNGDYPQGQSYISDLLYEWIAAYPDSTRWLESPWQIAATDPITLTLPGAVERQNLFSYAVEYELNVRQTPVEELQNWLAVQDFTVNKWFFAPDLFGPGQGGTIFQVSYYDIIAEYTNTFAIQPTDQGFKLRPVSGWLGAKYEDAIPVIQQDANHNGYSEIVVERTGGWSGWCDEYLNLFEWDGRAFEWLFSASVYNKQYATFGCEGTWAFEPVSGTDVSQLVIHDIFNLWNDCPPYEILRRYRWDGSMSETILSAEPKSAVCLANWGYLITKRTLTRQEQAPGIRLLERAIRAWDAEADKIFGSAGRDYLNLILGIWYDQGGQAGEALLRLEPLAQSPSSAQYDLPSRLAAAYLDGRRRTRLVGACLQAEALWEKDLQYDKDFRTDNVEGYIKKYGFYDPYWVDSGFVDDLCSISDLDEAGSLLGTFNTPENLSQAFAASGVTVSAWQAVDTNQDSRQDLVLLVNQPPYSSQKTWILIHTTGGYALSKILSSWEANENPPADLTIQLFQPEKNSPQALAILGAGHFYVIRVSGQKVNNLFEMSDVTAFNLRSTDSGESFDVTYTQTQYWDNKTITTTQTAIWEPLERKFILPSSRNLESTMDLSTAARLVYQEKDYPAALAYLQPAAEALAGRTSPGEVFYRSAIQYLLGVVYEKLGQPEDAVSAYYQAWQTAPGSTFGLAASGKLALKP